MVKSDSRATRASTASILRIGVTLAASGLLSLGGCAVASPDLFGADGAVGSAEQALTCTTVENIGPVTTQVEDAVLVTDSTDPTKASTVYDAVQQMSAGTVGTGYQRLIFKFDLLGAGIPANAIIASATLNVRMIQSLGKNPVEIRDATGPWTESAVTWNQITAAPSGGLGALEATVTTLGVPNNSMLGIPLSTSAVATWLTPATNYGVIFDHPAAGRTVFASSEGPVSSRPKLVVCYDVPTCADGIQNQGEGGVDCGGPCVSCPVGSFDTTFVAGSVINIGEADGQGAAATFGYVIGMRMDPSTGDVIVEAGSKIRRVTPGGLVTTIASNISAAGYASLGVDSTGNVYYMGYDGVHRISLSGVETVTAVQLPGITSFTVGPDDRGYVAYFLGNNVGGGLSEIDLQTGAARELFRAANVSVPTDLAVDGAGNVYMADVNYQQIHKYVAAQGVDTIFLSNTYALGIAVDPAGNVYANGSEYSPDGALVGSGFPAFQYGIAVDASGGVYVAPGNYTNGWAFSIVRATPAN